MAALLAAAMLMQMNIEAFAETTGPESMAVSASQSGLQQTESEDEDTQNSAPADSSETKEEPAQSTSEKADSETAESAGSSGESTDSELAGEEASSSAAESEAADSALEGQDSEEPEWEDSSALQAGEEGTAVQAAALSYEIGSLEVLKTLAGEEKIGLEIDETNKEISYSNGAALVYLSHTKPSVYSDYDIKPSTSLTGSTLLLNADSASAQVKIDGKVCTFQSLGGEDAAYKGAFSSGGAQIMLDKPLFINVQLKSSTDSYMYNLTWASEGKNNTQESIFASKIDGNGQTLILKVTPGGNPTETTNKYQLNSPFLGEVTSDLTVDLTVVDPGSGNYYTGFEIEKSGNAGIIAGTVSAGKLTVKNAANLFINGNDDAVTLSVASTDGYAGLLVGEVKNEAASTAETADAVNFVCGGGAENKIPLADSAETAVSAQLDAGGLIGRLGENAGAEIYADVELSKLSVSSSGGNAGGLAGSLGKGAKLTLQGKADVYGTISSNSGAAGALAGRLENNAQLAVQGAVTLNKNSDNSVAGLQAGGAVGVAEENAMIDLQEDLIVGGSVIGTEIAGGFAGKTEPNAKIKLASGKTIHLDPVEEKSDGIKAVAGNTAGGFIGDGEDIAISADDGTIFPAQTVGEQNQTTIAAGGLFGSYTVTRAGDTAENTEGYAVGGELLKKFPAEITNNIFAASGDAGGLFGVLTLGKDQNSSGIKFILDLTDRKVSPTCSININNNSNNSNFGGIAGKLQSVGGVSNALIVKNGSIMPTRAYSELTYYGGIIGMIGRECDSYGDTDYTDAKQKIEAAEAFAAALQTENVTVTAANPWVADNGLRGFGGIAGCLGTGSVLNVKDITVSTKAISSDGTVSTGDIWGGAGVVGSAQPGSVVKLSGTTDLSDVHYVVNDGKTAQIVGRQEAALIFAAGSGSDSGWTLQRSTDAVKIDDIGSYGEVIRLGGKLSADLITLNETTNAVTFSEEPDYSGDTVTISSPGDFALYAISLQSTTANNGDTQDLMMFCADSDYSGILRNKTLDIKADIDLSGTGITGINRDDGQIRTSFYGSINGNGHTIKLAVGEAYGMRGDKAVGNNSDGSGKIYYHDRLGLIGVAWREDTADTFAKDLTIAGCIYAESKETSAYIGGLAAVCQNGAATLQNVTSEVEVYLAGNSGECNVGGIVGYTNATSWNLHKVTSSAKILYGNNLTESAMIGGLMGKAENTANSSEPGARWGDVNASGAGILLDDVTISATIQPDGSSSYTRNDFKAGGLIAQMNAARKDATANIICVKKLVFNGFAMKSGAQSTAGGLLGYQWNKTFVYFNNEAGSQNGNDYALKVTNASITTGQADLGGLVYQTYGYWEVNSNGIDLSGATISTSGGLGLMIYNGQSDVVTEEKIDYDTALYLNMTANWDKTDAEYGNAYHVEGGKVSAGEKAVFDEIVAYSAKNGDKVFSNGQSVISLTTTGGLVNMDSSGKRNTYVNRTEFGKNHTANPNSRYYYNLNKIVTDTVTGELDTPQKLLLWSVYHYANSYIQNYFDFDDRDSKIIGGNDGSASKLDMKGYSYYPIYTDGLGSFSIQNAEITFYNSQIEALETGNKTTETDDTGLTAVSQHSGMHCGLFLNYELGKEAVQNRTLSIQNVRLAGSVGAVADTSGALVCCGVLGSESTSGALVDVDIDELTLRELHVTKLPEAGSQPLLFSRISQNTKLDMKTVIGSNLPKKAATSLIGPVGSENADRITLLFSDIRLPDTVEAGAFTHATLLESFAYTSAANANGSSAVYNFNEAEDWNDSEHIHHVTYGWEISYSNEYADQLGKQQWYKDKAALAANLTETAGKVYHTVPREGGGNTDFSKKVYLPYVKTPYQENSSYHEIKVNHVTMDLTAGCGSYGDPYVITTAQQLQKIAEFTMGNEGIRPDSITIVNAETEPAKQSQQYGFCQQSASEKNHTTYIYNGSVWAAAKQENGVWVADADRTEQLSMDTVMAYIRNAYYQIDGQIEVENFIGFGTSDNPFRGVIVGKNDKDSITLTGSNNTSSGLINYSFGSVVKNLTVKYDTSKNIIYAAPTAENWNFAVPNAFFGGIIGCVVGGDNIIDGVTVSNNGSITLSGTETHLIPTGGYVGVVSGGGVIFRNNHSADMTGFTIGDEKGFYHNKIIGRVLDGFAFSEKCQIDNGEDNYKINQISGENGTETLPQPELQVLVESNNNQIKHTVNIGNESGLLLLSAIVNSGAAGQKETRLAGNGSLAYLGGNAKANADDAYYFGNVKYGKSRTANYNAVGAVTDAKNKDWSAAAADDCQSPNPYLINEYVEGNGKEDAKYLTAWGVNINLTKSGTEATYDMTQYSTGYQGIGARYRSTAMLSIINGVPKVDYTTYTPQKNDGNVDDNTTAAFIPVYLKIKNFDGKNNIITAKTGVKEYTDKQPSEFHTNAVGALFNQVGILHKGVSQNIVFKDCSVKLSYYNKEGEEQESTSVEAAVGGFIAKTSKNSQYGMTYTFDNIAAKESSFSGGYYAGSILGITCAADSQEVFKYFKDIEADAGWGNNGEISTTFKNCSYDSILVSAKDSAGGLVGRRQEESDRRTTTIEVESTQNQYVLGKNSIISATDKGESYAGGLVGRTNPPAKVVVQNTAIFENNTISGEMSGGLMGHTARGATITNIYVQRTDNAKSENDVFYTTDGNNGFVGGLIGYGKGTTTIISSGVKGLSISNSNADTGYTGGLVGCTENSVEVVDAKVTRTNIIGGTNAGGLIGCACFKSGTASFSASEDNKENTVEETIIQGTRRAGGLVGLINNAFTISNTTVRNITATATQKAENNNEQDYKWTFAGGVVAHAAGSGVSQSFTNVQVDNAVLSAAHYEADYLVSFAGGIVGMAAGKATITKAAVTDLQASSANAIGGIAGALYKNGVNCIIENSTVQKSSTGTLQLGSTDTNNQMSGRNAVGGILGAIRNENADTSCAITGCTVEKAVIAVPSGNSNAGSNAGGLVGDTASLTTIDLRNNLVKSCTVNAGSSNAAAGGVQGALNGKLTASNLRLSDTGITAEKKGYLLGIRAESSSELYTAGFSVQKKADQSNMGTTKDTWYGMIGQMDTAKNSYIAMADYTGAENNPEGEKLLDSQLLKGTAADFAYANIKEPYAVTGAVAANPVYKTPVPSTGGTSKSYYFFGDGMGYTSSTNETEETCYQSTAQLIAAEAGVTSTDTRYHYSYAADANNSIALGTVSSYNAENPDEIIENDFPVLEISGGDVDDVIKDYLDILTNGGFRNAVSSNQQGTMHVSVMADTYGYSKENAGLTWIKPSELGSQTTPLTIIGAGTADMKFQINTSYDNGQNRVTMLSAAFSAAGQENLTVTNADYVLYVPVVVRRMLEVDSTVTLNYGTVFDKTEYQELGENAHVLDSPGNAITALISYQYNTKYGEYRAYGWESHLAAGGQMTAAEKSLKFTVQTDSNAVPEGTLLTLVDCASNNKVYTYKITASDVDSTNTTVELSEFTDSNGKNYQNKWLSEIMGVTATSNNASGEYVAITDKTKITSATARIAAEETDDTAIDGYIYYRPYDTAQDDNAARYDLKAAVTKNGNETQPTEDFYLTIYVPQQADDFKANGNLHADLKTSGISFLQKKINRTLRTDNHKADGEINTASSFSILSGYTQSLADRTEDHSTIGADAGKIFVEPEKNAKFETQPKAMTAGDAIQLNVIDKISFNSSQAYDKESDQLYYQLQVDLQKHDASQNIDVYGGLPEGVSTAGGTLKFYVYTLDGTEATYYTYTGEKWKESNEEAPVTEGYAWNSSMDILLSTDGTAANAISLQQLRDDYGKDKNRNEFYIRTEAVLYLSQDAFFSMIQAAKKDSSGNVNSYTRLHYHGVLAVKPESLLYSSMTAAAAGIVGYWRDDTSEATVEYRANQTSQLGINCSDLSLADGTIETTGFYSLEKMNKAEEILKASSGGVQYTLTLEKRNENGTYEQVDIDRYLESVSSSLDLSASLIKDRGKHYYQWIDKNFASQDASKKTSFTMPITIKVNTDIEGKGLTFANYRLRLSAVMLNQDNSENTATKGANKQLAGSTEAQKEDGYYSDYLTYTVTRIALDGLPDIDNG